MVKFFLTCHENISAILSVAALIVTIVTHDIFPKYVALKEHRNKEDEIYKRQKICLLLQFSVAFFLVFCSIFVWIKSYTTYCNWGVVPDLYGMTYDDAISALYDSGLTGHLLLASTNKNLSNSDSRVVWQSTKPGEVSDHRDVISFVIDDSFALDTIPLNQCAYVTYNPGTGQVLNYTCDYRDAIHQALEIESEAEQAGVSPVYELEAPHWYVEVEPPTIEINLTTGVWHGQSFTMTNDSYSYYTYAYDMAATLYEIAETSASRISNIELSNYLLVGKLIPRNNYQFTNAKMLRISDDNSILFLPLILKNGEYTFVFTLLDSDGNNYEWYHTIGILDKD